MVEHKEHAPPSATRLVVILVLLMALLVLTVAAWYPTRDAGGGNPIIGLLIAGVKALLVGWFFMDLKDASPMARLVSVCGLFWFGIMMLITLAELFSRGY